MCINAFCKISCFYLHESIRKCRYSITESVLVHAVTAQFYCSAVSRNLLHTLGLEEETFIQIKPFKSVVL